MSILTRWLLIPPVNARLIGRYREYRRHGASPFSATLGCFWLILAGFLFRWSTRAGSVFVRNIKSCSLISTPRARVRWILCAMSSRPAGC